jgi:hypothetical protein
MLYPLSARSDEASRKGAMEDDGPFIAAGPRSFDPFQYQLGHRDQDDMLKDNDSDSPGA